jgi:dCMP deaminase
MNTRWTEYFMSMARLTATMSKDPSTKCGAVVVDYNRRIVGQGYNGFPRGVIDDPVRYEDRLVKYKMTVHAEANAILNAVAKVVDCTLYATKFPCTECAKLIIQSGLSRVVSPRRDNPQDESAARWAEDAAISMQMMTEAGIIVVELP